MSSTYYVYIMTNWNHHVLYIGVTNNLQRRVYEHKTGVHDGFTKQYNVQKLVYCESCHEALDAIRREKQLKHWAREKKIQLIESANPHWEEIKV